MLTLPQGLVDGKSLVFYRNQSHLVQLIKYYLPHNQERRQIAREGRRIAMTMHRSWHRMGKVVF
jgi:spore maturation protein CgeB